LHDIFSGRTLTEHPERNTINDTAKTVVRRFECCAIHEAATYPTASSYLAYTTDAGAGWILFSVPNPKRLLLR
jgi:hypothetical protein